MLEEYLTLYSSEFCLESIECSQLLLALVGVQGAAHYLAALDPMGACRVLLCN